MTNRSGSVGATLGSPAEHSTEVVKISRVYEGKIFSTVDIFLLLESNKKKKNIWTARNVDVLHPARDRITCA